MPLVDAAPHNMTSNTAPWPYRASASSQLSSSYAAWYAFNGVFVDGYGWLASNTTPATPMWLQIEFPTQVMVGSYGIYQPTAILATPRNFTLQGSNNGTSWSVVDQRVGVGTWLPGTQKIFDVLQPQAFKFYRIHVTLGNDASYVAIAELCLYITGPQTISRFIDTEDPSTFPPRVDAGPDQYLYLNAPYEAALAGSSPDAVTYLWTKEWGPGTATFDDDTSPTTDVTFSVAGIYGLRLTVDDGALTNSRVVTINAEQQATARITQGPVETLLTETTVNARVTQGPVEVLMTSTGDTQRVSQVLVEAVQAQTATVRASQVVAEVLSAQPEFTRFSQLVVEVLMPGIVESRVSQAVAELVDAGQRPIRVTQIVVELLGKSSVYAGEPSLSPAVLCGKTDVLAWMEWTVAMRET